MSDTEVSRITGYSVADSLSVFPRLDYDYLFTSPPCYEDLESFGVTPKKPETYRTHFLSLWLPKAAPKLGTITISFTGARRHDGKILPKSFYLQQAMYDCGYYLRDIKKVKKSNSYNAYSHQVIEVLTFQKEGTKAVYNLRKEKLYDTYGKDIWGPFRKEQIVDGEVVGQPIEIAEYCVLNYTNEGHLVLDPFAGIGTTCEAARRHNRQYLGYEIRESIWQYGVNFYGL